MSNSASRQYLEHAEVRRLGTDGVAITTSGGHDVLAGVPAGAVKVSAPCTGPGTMEPTVGLPGGQAVPPGAFVVTSAREGSARTVTDQEHALDMKTVLASLPGVQASRGRLIR